MTKKQNEKRRRYSLEPRPIATGGQAEIFRGTHKNTGEKIAMKKRTSASEDAIARLRREIRFHTEVVHKNIMPIRDHSSDWYTMPLAQNSLKDLPRPFADDLIRDFAVACAQGLQRAHELNFIHRDLSPGNVLWLSSSEGDRWVVADAGLVRHRQNTTKVRTLAGQEIGTAGFSAPEMWHEAHDADARADVYSLGRLVAWSLSTQDLIPNVPVTISGSWRDFVDRATALRPEDRFQSMAAVLEYLATLAPPPVPTKVVVAPSSITSPVESSAGQRSTHPSLVAVLQGLAQEREDAARRVEEQARATAARAALSTEGARVLAEIVRDFFSEIRRVAQLPPEPNAKEIRLGKGRLVIRDLGDVNERSFSRSKKRVVRGASVTVIQDAGYRGRGANLWFADWQNSGEYLWWEVPYMSMTGQPAINPFAVEELPELHLADEAHSPVMGIFQQAATPIPLDRGGVAEFYRRWEERLAQAALGRLQPPRHLPE